MVKGNRMILVKGEEFNTIAGSMMPVRRDMKTFNGDEFECICGKTHVFYKHLIHVLSEGYNGKFLVACPENNNLITLIQTKMKWGILYQGLESLAGTKI